MAGVASASGGKLIGIKYLNGDDEHKRTQN